MVEAARALRREATPAERLLWEQLRTQRFEGLKFRRQHAVGTYVLDFFCAEPGVAIEIDGSAHETPEQRDRDAERTASLVERRIRVLRFRNEQVFNDMASVLAAIYDACARPPAWPPPQPSPNALGEGWGGGHAGGRAQAS